MLYYSTQRPIGPGSFPKPKGIRVLRIVEYIERRYVKEIDREAWGCIEYSSEIPEEDAKAYELVKAPEAAEKKSSTIELPEGELSEESFRVLAQEVLPHLRTIQEATVKALGKDGGASLHVGDGGYLEFTPYKSNWRLVQYREGKPSIRYEYKEAMPLEETET